LTLPNDDDDNGLVKYDLLGEMTDLVSLPYVAGFYFCFSLTSESYVLDGPV
jgi:hypothetical protein